MRLDNQRRSSNVEDRRGQSGGGGGGFSGGLPLGARGLGLGGVIILGLILLFAPPQVRNMILGQVLGGGGSQPAASAPSAAGRACVEGDPACDFATRVLGSTEDIWAQIFTRGALPNYGAAPSAYEAPRLVLFSDRVETGCGAASSAMGPFYCPADRRLYIDPTFYDVMARRLQAPGDFAQAYVIAHEVAHHVQNLIGATRAGPREAQNQHSVRVELQADCLAGVWGHNAQANLQIDQADLQEALNAAHQIGDDTLQRNSRGAIAPDQFTHGSSEQRMRWFRRGFDSGDARQCDTMQSEFSQL